MQTTATQQNSPTDLAVDALRLATPDLARVERELELYDADPEAYIARRFTELAEWDFPVWAAINVFIKTKKGQRVRLKLNRIQRRMWEWLLEDLAARRPVRWFILKARQEGVSTFWLAVFLWLTSLRPNREALICSLDEASTFDFNHRIRAMYTQLHPMLQPMTHTENRELVYFGTPTLKRKQGAGVGLESKLVFSTAQRGELGRSYNFHAVLLSEFAIWPEKRVDVQSQMGGLMQVMSDEAGTIIILESTAKGENEATKWWTEQDNGYRKVFIPWCAFDEYRTAQLKYDKLKELSADPDSRYGNEIEAARVVRETLPLWYPQEAADEGWLDEEVRRRLHWRRRTIDTKCNGNLQTFNHEYPLTPADSFATGAKNLFDHESIEEMRAHVLAEGYTPIRCKLIQNDDEIHPNRKFHRADGYGKVYFYRLPGEFQREHTSFVIGADTSMGMSADADPSAAVVLGVSADETEEVASFNAVIAPHDFAELLNWLGRLYDDALLGVEHNERGGAVVNDYLHKVWRYPRLYFPRDMFTGKTRRDTVPGVNVTGDGKSKLVSDLAEEIVNHTILFRSIKLIDQLKTYQVLKNNKLGGAPGTKDDFVSAAMIARFLKKHIYRFSPPREAIPRGSFLYEAQRLARTRGLRVPGI
jgi:hypothetical protein